MENRNSGTLLALLAGIAIGTGIGILLSSEKGSELKDKIKNAFQDKIAGFRQMFEEIAADVQSRLGDTVSNLKAEFDNLTDNIDDYSDDAIQVLEKKLEDLKKAAINAKQNL